MKSIFETTCIYKVKPCDVIYFIVRSVVSWEEDVFLGQGAARLKVGEGQYKQNDIK